MDEKIKRLLDINHDVYNLNAAIALADWDQQTYMPKGAAEDRGETLSTLARLAHEMIVSGELGRLLDDLKTVEAQLDPDSMEARLIKVSRKRYERETRVSSEWVSEYFRLTATAHQDWERAKTASDFSIFKPSLERMVELMRQFAGFFQPCDHLYDALLDGYEPGMKTAEVQAIFDALRPQQVALLQAIAQRPQVDNSFLHLHYPEEKQWEFGVNVITRFGYDWEHGRQDKAMHPFTTNFGIGDVRITTRFIEDDLGSALFSTTHEAGHAMYEQGISQALNRTVLAAGASMAVHESQSRMWENLVSRSLPFWRFFYPILQKTYPAQLGNVNLATFYKGINRVEPSFIRVEADEASYNLHVMLRLELEIALMEGSLQVADLPEAWNARMRDYLGITPPDDAHGVLQDVHWSSGYFGYFPTYALGNLVSVQLWECIQRDIPDLEAQISRGEFAALLGWLREKVHVHGAKFEPQELVQRITGSRINPLPYMGYLQTKYGEIYGL